MSGSHLLAEAVVWMNLALVLYSRAVFSARKRGLQRGHLALFGTGLVADYLGTRLMLLYGLATGVVPRWHIAVGLASLSGMAFHFLLALAAALLSRREAVNRLFHRVSLGIYSGWLIAFVSGAVAGMTG